jgi:DNA-binding transcriptional ArsR family regulator
VTAHPLTYRELVKLRKKRQGDGASRRELRRLKQAQRAAWMSDTRPWWQRRWWTRWPGRLIQAPAWAIGKTGRLGWRTIIGRWRTVGWPVWAAAAAVAVTSPWPWLGAALVLSCLPWFREITRARKRRMLSDREAYLWASAATELGAYRFVTGLGVSAPWWTPVLLLTPIAAYWWWNRRARPMDKFAMAWELFVASEKDYAGTRVTDVEVTEDPESGHPEGTFRIEVAKGDTAAGIAKDDLTIASHLTEAYPGLEESSLTISKVPGDGLRTARGYLADPRKGNIPRYWDGPTLDSKTGIYLPGWTGHEDAAMREWQPAGGVNTFAIGGPGVGKGALTILGGVEDAQSDVILNIYLDGKRGSGIPVLKEAGALYAKTPAEWIIAWNCAMDMMRLRFDLYGADGTSLFVPRRGNPLIKVTGDEWRYIHKAWPQMIEDGVWWTGQSRSLGGHLHLNLHKGDGDGYGDPEIRSNGYANGQVAIGRAGDTAAEGVAVQGWEVDPDQLPPYPGWFWVCQSIDGAVNRKVKMRVKFLPTRVEVEQTGCDAPFGTAEDWLRDAIRFPSLPPEMQKILDTSRELIESGKANEDPELIADALEKASGKTRDNADWLIQDYLREHPNGAGPGQIASSTGLNPSYVSTRLRALREEEKVTQTAERQPWRLVLPPAQEEPAFEYVEESA